MRRIIKRRCSFLIKITSVFLIVICLFLACEKQVKPVVLEIALSDAQGKIERVINNAIYDTFDRENIDFSDLVNVVYDDDKQIKSVNVDSVFLNRLKLKISKNYASELAKIDTGTVCIKAGSFIDNEFFYGRGPNIYFDYEVSNTIGSEFVSEFVSAGINQTKHNLYLKYSVDLELITPFLDTDTVFESQVLVNEMILVGEVPSTYLSVE